MLRALIAITFIAGISLGAFALLAADNSSAGSVTQPAGNAGAPGAAPPEAQGAAPSAQAAGTPPASGGSPVDTAEKAPKGSLKSPFPDPSKVADEGHQKFMAAGCNGCHGGTGGGGMGPPLTNSIWVYGNDDDTLFRLIALGTDALQKQGYTRKGSESVVGPMPQMGGVVKSDDDLWKIIAWIKTNNTAAGAASSTNTAPGATKQ
jgi:hypothetical protein